jgi:aminoglycoside phosphotransferase (APT) family kinase protein
VRTARLVVTAPRAVGRHAPYAAVPDRVRRWVEATLGSPVVSAADQIGGMSPGCATRLVCADGTRAFVKAVGVELNPDTPMLFRREQQALTLLGSHSLWADLLASYDEAGWVALLLEDVEGVHPDLSDDATMARLLDQTDELVTVMNARIDELPAVSPPTERPPQFRPGPADMREAFIFWREALAQAPDIPSELLPRWVVDRLPQLLDLVDHLVEAPNDHVVHFDIRDDNLIQRPSGELVFLDWGAFGVGPGWLDPLLARAERVDSPWFDTSLASSPQLAAAGEDLVTAWLVAFGASLAWRAHTDSATNLPALQAFRRVQSGRFLGAARRRLDPRI